MTAVLTKPEVHKATFAARHPVATYYGLTLLLSWSIQLGLVAVKQGWVGLSIPFSVHYLASFGPALAAVIVTALVAGTTGLKELWSRLTKWRVGWAWYVVAIFSPLAVFAASLPVVYLIKGAWPDLRLLGQANYLPYLGWGVLPLWLITFGFGEETGWRGFALPRLQRSMSVSRATLTLGLMWALWHAPAFFYLDTFEQLPLYILPGFLVGVLFAAVIFTWIYNGSGGSILMVALWHGLYDLTTASKAGQDIIPIVMTAYVIVMALVITRVNAPWNFHRVGKQVA